MRAVVRPEVKFAGRSALLAALLGQAVARGIWTAQAYYPWEKSHGGLWGREKKGPLDVWENLITNQGLDNILDVHLSAATQITTWYLLLINGASPTIAAANTYASHAGWSENTSYDEANRPTWTEAGVSSQAITNSASPATFTISANSQTIGGAALVSNNTKGDTAAAGAKLYAAGAFTSAKALDDNETLDVTATFTAADA